MYSCASLEAILYGYIFPFLEEKINLPKRHMTVDPGALAGPKDPHRRLNIKIGNQANQ
jgi:hypothetical protein